MMHLLLVAAFFLVLLHEKTCIAREPVDLRLRHLLPVDLIPHVAIDSRVLSFFLVVQIRDVE